MTSIKEFVAKKDFALPVLLLTLLMAVFVYTDVLMTIGASWQKDEYSYAYFVPPLALLFALHRLAAYRHSFTPSWPGVALVLAGLGLHVVGKVSGITTIPQYGFFITFLGTILTLTGQTIFVRLFPALFYLFFAIPLPTTFYISFSAKLQLLSSSIGSTFLHLLGFSVFQDGNVIDLGNYQLQVVEACSGLRYIFPLMGFSYLVAYFLKDSFWKKFVVFISALPLAVMLNVARITLVGVTVNYWGTQAAEGLLHDFEGWVAFSVCVVILFVLAWALMRIGPKKGDFDFDHLSLPHGPYVAKPMRIGAAFIVVSALFAGVAVGQITGLLSQRAEVLPIHASSENFPVTLGAWQGKPDPLTADMLALLKTSDYLNIDFTQGEQRPGVNLFVAYYASQRGENNLHSPEMCIPGSGWNTVEASEYKLIYMPKGRQIVVNRSHIQKGSSHEIVYYWFEQNGRSISNRYEVKVQTIWNALMTGRTDSALLRLDTALAPNEKIEDADRRLQAFLAEADPALQKFLPNY